MKHFLLKYYRSLPRFKGKLRIGKLFFSGLINRSLPVSFTAHDAVSYSIPNTKENLGVELMINGVYEEDVIRFLKNKIPDCSVYFDIGANIGSLALPVLKKKQHIKYVGFEASPIVFEYLENNFQANHIPHFQLHNKIVHKDDMQSMKFYQAELYGKSSLAPTYSLDFVMIHSVSIDKYCSDNNINFINWMKVDVQGFEIYVFEGMKKMLAEKRIENILFEFEPWAEEEACVKPGSAIEYIRNEGYDLFTLDGRAWNKFNKKMDTMIWAKPKFMYDK